ncbi:MAG: sigma 54-interacting transcriptional regulator [Polyangiales bacterium]
MKNQQNFDDSVDQPRAFIVVKDGDRSWVMDVPLRKEVKIGSADQATLRLESSDVNEHHATLVWDGALLALRVDAEKSHTFLNGKRLAGSAELKPGDEIGVGGAQLVVGIAVPPSSGGRRALTHHEFRERLYEEVARASRSRRPTSLVMVEARPGDGGRIAGTALDSFRAGDVVGTFAHDELEFLLPDTPIDVARAVVTRIISESGAEGAIAGIAAAPEHGDNPERLFREARRAMEAASKTGLDIATPPPRTTDISTPGVHDAATKELVDELKGLADKGFVLLTGEVSSGKVRFARLMHDFSSKKGGAFEVIACAQIDPDEPELDALKKQVQAAKNGTLVLDEVGDLPPKGQTALLAALKDRDASVRLLATTHRALGGLVDRGAFNAELYQLLQGEFVEVPPLRNRPEDIIPLATRFAIQGGASEPVQFSPGALARLRSYPWPGNVLELRNSMERAVRLARGTEILAEHLPSDALTAGSGDGRLREHVDSVERDAIIKALADSNHNQTHAAKRLGVSRRALIYKMEKYGLKPPPGLARKGGA